MVKKILVGSSLGLLVITYVVMHNNYFTTTHDQYTPSGNDESVTVSRAPLFLAARQYQSLEEEVLTVTEYDSHAFVIGAGLDRLILPRLPESPTPYFSNDQFSLTLNENTVRVWLDDIPYYEGQERYDAASWELVIPATCQRFFDGCNTCTKEGGCTKIGCEVYEQPRCIDEAVTSDEMSDYDQAILSDE